MQNKIFFHIGKITQKIIQKNKNNYAQYYSPKINLHIFPEKKTFKISAHRKFQNRDNEKIKCYSIHNKFYFFPICLTP